MGDIADMMLDGTLTEGQSNDWHIFTSAEIREMGKR